MFVIIGAIFLLVIFVYLFYLIVKDAGVQEERKNNLKKIMSNVAESIKIKKDRAKDSISTIKEKMKRYTRD